MAEIQALKRWKPFSDKSGEMVSFILSARRPTDSDRILYENFAAISREIYEDYQYNFHKLPYELQAQVITAKVDEYRNRIEFLTAEMNDPLFMDDTEMIWAEVN